MTDRKIKLKNTNLTNYLKKSIETIDNLDNDNTTNDSSTCSTPLNIKNCQGEISFSIPNFNCNDIGNFFKQDNISDERKKRCKSLWYPDITYKFPISGKRNLKFQFSWFNR